MVYNGLAHKLGRLVGLWGISWNSLSLFSSSKLAEASSQDGLRVQRWQVPTYKLLFMFHLSEVHWPKYFTKSHLDSRAKETDCPSWWELLQSHIAKRHEFQHGRNLWPVLQIYHTRSILYKVNTEIWQLSN